MHAVAGDAHVALSWNRVTGANSYSVKRSSTIGGPYTDVATVTGLGYTDTAVVNGSTYYYVTNAVNAVGASPDSLEVSGTPTAVIIPEPVTGHVKVQYKTNDTNATDNQFRPQFNIINTGTESIALSNVKLRYYYTIDGDKPQQFNCDYAALGGSDVRGTFVKLNNAVALADYYLDISFGDGAGSLAPGASSGDIQVRINKNDWSNYNETNDYSYDSTKTSYTDSTKVPAYVNGTLVWGLEP